MAATASTTLGIDLPKFVPSSVTLATLAEAIREAFGAVDGKPAVSRDLMMLIMTVQPRQAPSFCSDRPLIQTRLSDASALPS